MLGPHSGMSGSGTEPVINFGQQTGHNCFQQHVLKQSFHEVVVGGPPTTPPARVYASSFTVC